MNKESNEIWKNWEKYISFELRKHRFRKEMLPIIYSYLGIKSGYKVLDAGCGTGVFTRYLSGGIKSGKIIGFDINKSFIEYGRKKIKELSLDDKVSLEVADGFNLHYPDNSFDTVTNYTYIGVLSDPIAGLKELIRVCKNNGTVSCVVATNRIPEIGWQGDYNFERTDRLQGLVELEKKIYKNHVYDPSYLKQSSEWHAFRYPKMFDICGLKNIHIYPLAYTICYNDTQYPLEYRKKIIEEGIAAEIEWLKEKYNKNKEKYNKNGFIEQDYKDLISLLEIKANYLSNNLKKDKSYEWHGGFNFIVTGIKRDIP